VATIAHRLRTEHRHLLCEDAKVRGIPLLQLCFEVVESYAATLSANKRANTLPTARRIRIDCGREL
jgi:hypothetical protein